MDADHRVDEWIGTFCMTVAVPSYELQEVMNSELREILADAIRNVVHAKMDEAKLTHVIENLNVGLRTD